MMSFYLVFIHERSVVHHMRIYWQWHSGQPIIHFTVDTEHKCPHVYYKMGMFSHIINPLCENNTIFFLECSFKTLHWLDNVLNFWLLLFLALTFFKNNQAVFASMLTPNFLIALSTRNMTETCALFHKLDYQTVTQQVWRNGQKMLFQRGALATQTNLRGVTSP